MALEENLWIGDPSGALLQALVCDRTLEVPAQAAVLIVGDAVPAESALTAPREKLGGSGAGVSAETALLRGGATWREAEHTVLVSEPPCWITSPAPLSFRVPEKAGLT